MTGACGDCDNGCASGASSCAPIASKSFKERSVCMKCRENQAVILANQTEPMCSACLRISLLSKVKTVLNNHAVISAQDRILVSFSGGAASRVALELVREIRSEALASRAHNAPTFELGVVFIDEGLALGFPEEERKQTVEAIHKVVSGLDVKFHCHRLEEVFQDEGGGGSRLQALLDSVKDRTGKEDLVEILRMELLEQLAKRMNYTKVVLGLCTTRIASRVVAGTAKGQGFSLAAGVQYVDARWHAPVILPLRDCAAKELASLCHHFHLETVFVRNLSTLVDSSTSTINGLCNNFVLTLREDNSARDHTIARTAGKLTPFSFNKLAQDTRPGRKRRVGNKTDVPSGDELISETLCALCRDPVDTRGESSGTLFCPSCKFQIVNDTEVSGLLPKFVQERSLESHSKQELLKSQISEYLIPDEE